MIKRKVPALIVAVPIVLVNIVAVIGQYAFLREHLPSWGIFGAVLFAAALESTAVFLAGMSHASLMAGDSATRIRIGSYAFGAVIGVMNGSHYARHGHVTFEAVALGIMSASSPWLWAIYSRRQSRDSLLERGLIEGHAVRLGVNRWLFHPVLSFRVFSRATWLGETDPGEAISLLDSREVATVSEPGSFPEVQSKADAVRYAANALALADHGDLDALTASQVHRWLSDHAEEIPVPGWPIPVSYVADVLRRDRGARERISRARTRAIESGQVPHE